MARERFVIPNVLLRDQDGKVIDVFPATFDDLYERRAAANIGEIINMVCGNAKAAFQRKNVSISCPSVVVGKNHRVASQSDIPCVLIPCTTDCGEMNLEVAIRPVAVEAVAA